MSLSVLSHITIICHDLDKTSKFLCIIFGAVECYATQEKIYSLAREKFFKIGDLWLVTMEGKETTKTYNHIAFQVPREQLPILRNKLIDLNLEILPGRNRSPAEGESIYFYDYDNHLFELHSGNLDQRLKYYQHGDDPK